MADSPRTKRLINRIYEAFADVGKPDASVNEEALRLRAEIAYDALRAEEKVYPPEEDCPHAAPFRMCPRCVVSPCPIGLPGPEDRREVVTGRDRDGTPHGGRNAP